MRENCCWEAPVTWLAWGGVLLQQVLMAVMFSMVRMEYHLT